jgi:hypothetical protein
MTDDNSNKTNVDMDDLDAFEDVFYGDKPEPKAEVEDDEAPEDEVTENEDDALETEEEDTSEEDEVKDEEEEPEEEPAPKPKGKKSFQQRIDELTADKYERQREVDFLRAEIEKLKVRPEEKQEVDVREQLPANAPSPDAVNDKGEPVYPLGEFDPKFIRDLTKFTFEEETKAADERRKQEAEVRAAQEANQKLTESWNEKLEKAEADIPDIRKGITELTPILTDLDPGYGNYLAATVMQCDNGPEVMYYLSQNIGEAQKIVASGAFAATLAIGRLDAQFSKSKPQQEEKRNTKVVSDAPKPAEARARGRGSSTVTRPDTDDLDAFEKIFFAKKRR